MTTRTTHRLIANALLVSAGVVLPGLVEVADAAPKSWDRGASTDNWGDAANWNLDGVPAVNDSLTIDHAWQGVAAAFTVDLGGVSRDLGITGSASLTINGQDATIRPTIQNGTILTNGEATLNISQATITATIRGTAGSYLLGNTTFTDVNHTSVSSSGWENRGKTWAFTDSAINIGTTNFNILTIKANTVGTIQGTATLDNTSMLISHFSLGEYALSDSVAATLNLTNGSTLTATNSDSSVGNTTQFGLLNIADSTVIVRKLILGLNGKLTTSNGVIDLRTSSSSAVAFDNRLTDDTRFDGDGLTIRNGAGTATTRFEVAGVDVGRLETIGYDNNFWMSELQLGVNAGQTFMLVDGIDNQVNGATNEALYIDTLRILGNTTLDLNGLNLYYRNLVNTGGFTLTQLNGLAVRVPEPATAGLLMLGVIVGLRRRGWGT